MCTLGGSWTKNVPSANSSGCGTRSMCKLVGLAIIWRGPVPRGGWYQQEMICCMVYWHDTILYQMILALPSPFQRKLKSVHNATNKVDNILNSYSRLHVYMFKKRIMSTFLGLMLLLLAAITLPGFENNLSDGTDVPGTHKYFLVRSCNCGRWKESCVRTFILLPRAV